MSLEQLWKLQEVDLSIKALEDEAEQAPLKAGIEEAAGRLAQLKADLSAEEESLKELRKRLKGLELDLQKNSDSRAALKKRLYGGEVANVRELEQMEIKLGLLEKEQSAREEQTLELMEAAESGEELLRARRQKAEEEEGALQDTERQLAQTLERIHTELSRIKGQREEMAALVEPRLLERYQQLTQKHHGRALARVIHDICGGCRVFISSAQQGFLRNPQAMVYCESCGRLLVKLSEHSETG